MNYIENFIFINLAWGVITLFLVHFSEIKPFKYTKCSIILLVLGWIYLAACAPIFRDSDFIPDNLSIFYMCFTIILSIEVWVLILLTLLGVGLAKKSHDPEHKSYMLRFHKPLNKITKPLWKILAIANVVNASSYFLYN
ncbi:MAG: hypothetical protein ABF294_08215 [Flavobacteriales bacterium]